MKKMMETHTIKNNYLNSANIERRVGIVLWLLIILYPFITSFMGIDLGDTGLHVYAYEHIFDMPEQLSFTSYLSLLIGWAWLKIFPSLGLWGLNLLEVFLEIAIAFVVYKVLSPWLGKITTLLGILIAVLAMDTYLNVFNHHQLNVFLLVCILALEFRAITTDKLPYSFFTGICIALVVASRMGSITAITTLVLYLVWFAYCDKTFLTFIRHIGVTILGAITTALALVAFMRLVGHFDYFYKNIFRLADLASGESGGGGYQFDSLLRGFIGGNLKAIASGALYLAAFLFLVLGLTLIFKSVDKTKKRCFNVLFGTIVVIIAIYLLIYSYDVNPVPAWPQMTTGPGFVIGVLYTVAFLCLGYNVISSNGKIEYVYISIMAYMLPLLTIAGANTGTKHTVLGLWYIAPLCVYVIRSALLNRVIFESVKSYMVKIGIIVNKYIWRISIIIVCVFFLAKFGDMIYRTANFDSINRFEITESINSDKLKFLQTTKREAESVNGILDAVNKIPDREDRTLLVYGGSLLYYYILDMKAYVQPWFTSGVYPNEILEKDLVDSSEKLLPIVIFCRTNNNYGFYEVSYNVLINSQLSNGFGGKRDIFLDFLQKNNYMVDYVNDYYCVFCPPEATSSDDNDFTKYILNV